MKKVESTQITLNKSKFDIETLKTSWNFDIIRWSKRFWQPGHPWLEKDGIHPNCRKVSYCYIPEC